MLLLINAKFVAKKKLRNRSRSKSSLKPYLPVDNCWSTVLKIKPYNFVYGENNPIEVNLKKNSLFDVDGEINFLKDHLLESWYVKSSVLEAMRIGNRRIHFSELIRNIALSFQYIYNEDIIPERILEFLDSFTSSPT